MLKKYNTLIIGLIAFLLVISISNHILAADNNKDIKERMKLIRSSKKLVEEKSEFPSNEYGLYLTNFGTESKEANLGIKLGIMFPQRKKDNNKNSKWKYIFEGIYLKDEDTAAGFISIKRTFNSLQVNPYYGFGSEITGRANYQIFTGMKINSNFFIELKIINEKGEFKESDAYSAIGYQINY